MKAVHVIYEGRVQGVGFRYTLRELAKGFDVTGSVENLPDGTVKLIAESEDPDELEEFLNEIEEESAVAHFIKKTLKTEAEPSLGSGFRIVT